MKITFTLSVLLLTGIYIFSQQPYNDPNYPKPASGYGSDGPHTVGIDSIINPNYLAKEIVIYYPSDVSTKVPTIFYNHAYGGSDFNNVSGMLNFVAKKGYAIVFVPYKTVDTSVYSRYHCLLEGFRRAARHFTSIIDTSKVGFLGHSFGGGSLFANAYTCFTENNWGKNGRFLYALAPWYSFNITQSQIQAFPSNTKLLTEIFDDDVTNDHRMACDIFNNINISTDEKDFLLLKSDTVNGTIYIADHVVPNTVAAFNAFDYYAYYRLLDALCDYTFNGNLAGKNVALGNGSVSQITMPAGLKNLIQTDYPVPAYHEYKYEFPFHSSTNVRASYFDSTVAATNNGPVCIGSTLSLTGMPSTVASFAWTGPNGYSSISQNPIVSDSALAAMSGNYILTAALGNGAKNIALTTVTINGLPAAKALNNGPLIVGTSLLLTGAPDAMSKYSWTGPNNFTSIIESPNVSDQVTTAMAGTYILTVTDNNGCQSKAATGVIINDSPKAIEKINNAFGLKVYPNPVTNNLNVMLPIALANDELKIYNPLGELIYSEKINGRNSVNINMVSFLNGLYYITIGDKKLIIIKKQE